MAKLTTIKEYTKEDIEFLKNCADKDYVIKTVINPIDNSKVFYKCVNDDIIKAKNNNIVEEYNIVYKYREIYKVYIESMNRMNLLADELLELMKDSSIVNEILDCITEDNKEGE